MDKLALLDMNTSSEEPDKKKIPLWNNEIVIVLDQKQN